MANESTAVYPTADSFVDKTAAGTFIPEIWSDEVIAAYKKSLKMAPLVKKMTMKGKKGDVIHVPMPLRGEAAAKLESTAVNIQAKLEEELTITINRHFEYSRLIEDIVDVQALSSLRRFYTEDAGYQLARQVDTDLFSAATGFGSGTMNLVADATGARWDVNTNVLYQDTGTTLAAYAMDTVVPGDVFTDTGFRILIKKLDDADVPMDNRCFIIPPTLRSNIMANERYVSSDFRDARTVQTGLIGSVYGIDIYVSSNCPIIEPAAANPNSTVDTRAAIIMHKEALVLAEQLAVRSQTQYKQEYLSTLYTADTLYGVQVYRPEAGFVLAVPDV